MSISPDDSWIDIEISDTQAHLRVDRRALAAVVRETLAMQDVSSASISLALVDDATIHDLNRRHLDHDWPTDVITFPLSAPGDPTLAAELVVSTETALRAARASGGSPSAELSLYVVHGLLHLCGHDDHSSEGVAAMRRREAEVLSASSHVEKVAAVRGGQPCPR
jgi:probable rRNA maturation factor